MLERSNRRYSFGRLRSSAASIPAQAGQVGAIKDGWLVTKVHSGWCKQGACSSGSNIGNNIKNGVVTLQGTVGSRGRARRAVEVAKANDSIKSVVNGL